MSVLAAVLLVVSHASPGDQDWARESRPAPKEEEASTYPSSKRVWQPNGVALAIGATAAATAIGLGACSWFARENDAGYGCTIVAGSLSLGLFFPLMLYGLVRAYAAERPKEAGDAIVAGVLLSYLSSIAGLVVGAVIAGIVGKEPGTQRGVVGLSASGLLLAGGITLPFIFSF